MTVSPKLSSKYNVILQLALLPVIMLGVAWFSYAFPKSRLEPLKREIASLNQENTRQANIIKNLKPLRQEYNDKQKLRPLMQKLLPTEIQTSKFLTQVLDSARGLDLDFLNIGKPRSIGRQNPGDVLQRVQMDISLRGSFPDFISYLDKLRRIQRLFNISKLQVQIYDEVTNEIKVDLTIETYAMS